jgi:Fic family protein
MSSHRPPLTLTPKIVSLVAEISDQLGRWSVQERTLAPHLRRDNRIRTIQASLAIENNTLSVEQVTAVLDGKRVLGLPREIQEVRNAFVAYELLPQWQPHQLEHLLSAHAALLAGLLDAPGHFRAGGVGIYRGTELIHMAPPASRVYGLMQDLLAWLASTDWHPLVASCVFHYEFEFIHPFADGNGRMGRLWQTLILSHWKPELAWLPVETVIRDHQAAYYDALAQSDKAADAAAFVEFMLAALLQAMQEVANTEQASEHVSEHVKRLLSIFTHQQPLEAAELMARLALRHRPTFSKNYLAPAVKAGLVEMTQPDSPRSPTQQYRLTAKGRLMVQRAD